MLGMFFVWLATAFIEARKQRNITDEVLGQRGWPSVLSCIVGLGFLFAAGNLIVAGAQGIAIAFSIDAFVIGATIVAVGTSVSELATSVVAKLRGHDEVSLGTILGSNIFNGIFIVAVAAILSPITVSWREVAVALVTRRPRVRVPHAQRLHRTQAECLAAGALCCLSHDNPSTPATLKQRWITH